MSPFILRLLLISLVAVPVAGVAAAPQEDGDFQRTATSAQEDLDSSLKELSELREAIAAEKLPLTRKLAALESRLIEVRRDHDDVRRLLDTRNLALNNLRTEMKARQEEKSYLSNLLDEYIRNFETRVHIVELQRYREQIDAARLAPEKGDLSPAEIYRAQTELVEASLDRLNDLLGGATFSGVAVGEGGLMKEAEFALVGPVALYAAKDGVDAGLAEQRVGSLEPHLFGFQDPEHASLAASLVATGAGKMPFDASLGNARKIEATQETLWERIRKGGPVMVPILAMAVAALLVAVLKWVQISRVRNPSSRRVRSLMQSLENRDFKGASAQVDTIRGPSGVMLRAGVDHLHEPKDLVEEVMFERMLETRLRLHSFLPFVALAASAAPLLGLLGTVTGMINTFKLITVFGSGDAGTLSSGISEALITTQFGLIVAIPSLLLYAYLSRKARGLVDGMEKLAVSFLNRISATPAPAEPAEAAAGS
jgi:biopolymer transport protein ExbB